MKFRLPQMDEKMNALSKYFAIRVLSGQSGMEKES